MPFHYILLGGCTWNRTRTFSVTGKVEIVICCIETFQFLLFNYATITPYNRIQSRFIRALPLSYRPDFVRPGEIRTHDHEVNSLNNLCGNYSLVAIEGFEPSKEPHEILLSCTNSS